jgi:hypothetical protein
MRPVRVKCIAFPLYIIDLDRNLDFSFLQRVVHVVTGSVWEPPMRALRVVAVAMALALALLASIASAASSIGLVKVTEGVATVTRGDATLQARPGFPLQEGDVLRTGADGRMGVVLRDETKLSLGPESEIQLDRFAFAPAEGRLALGAKIARGVVAFVSGSIAKLSNDAVRIETPVAILGVRGTQFLAKVEPP